MTDIFSGILGDDATKSIVEVLNKLLDSEDIEMKTDLNISQIAVLTELFYNIGLLKGEDPRVTMEETIKRYLMYMVSLKRKSREEIVKGVSEMKEKALEQEMLMSGLMSKK